RRPAAAHPVRRHDRHCAAPLRGRVEPAREGARGVHTLPPERVSRGVAVHGLARKHQVPPQAADGAPVNDFGLALAVLLSYLMGATPTSYIAGRLGRGIDLREHG